MVHKAVACLGFFSPPSFPSFRNHADGRYERLLCEEFGFKQLLGFNQNVY